MPCICQFIAKSRSTSSLPVTKARENDELDLGLQKTYVFFILVGFCLGFSVFFDLGILELRVEKKKRKKMRALATRGTGDGLLRPACPPPAPLRPGPGPPARLPLRALLAANCQLYLGQFDLLLGPQKLLFSCWRRKWEMLSTFQHAVGTDVPSKTLQYPPDDCMGPRVGKGSRQARYLQGHRV